MPALGAAPTIRPRVDEALQPPCSASASELKKSGRRCYAVERPPPWAIVAPLGGVGPSMRGAQGGTPAEKPQRAPEVMTCQLVRAAH
jgi:hypothetical protein